MRLPPLLTGAALALGSLSACGDSGTGACSAATREALNPDFAAHVLGDVDVDYATDPPTSGPHQPSPTAGVVTEPLTRPIQVGILESGHVLVQYLPSTSSDDVERLQALAGDQVAVAPNPDLPEPVVATAWLFKQTCSEVDISALEEFIADRVGRGPDG